MKRLCPEAYRALGSQCWYVLAPGIGTVDDLPPEYGVMLAEPAALVMLRPAPRRALRLPFMPWMALARASAEPPLDDDAQPGLQPPEA